MAARRDHEVPGRVRELVQERDRGVARVHAQRLVGGERACRLDAEDAALLLVRLRDVLETPRRPQRLRHGAFLPLLAPSSRALVDSRAMGYALKLGGAAIAFLLLGVLGIIIFEGIWMRVGLGAAIVVVCGGLLLFAWRTDRKDKAARAGLDELPRV